MQLPDIHWTARPLPAAEALSKKDAVQVPLPPGVAGDVLQEEQAAAARLPPDREHGAHQDCHHAGKGKVRGELLPYPYHAASCTTADMSPCTWHCLAAEGGVYRNFSEATRCHTSSLCSVSQRHALHSGHLLCLQRALPFTSG